MSQIKAFVRARDAALRSLNEASFDKFAYEWSVPQPAQWPRGAKLAAMHKARLQIISFTPEEKATSREWLAANGFTDKLFFGAERPANHHDDDRTE